MKTLLLFLLASTACLAQDFTVTRTGLLSKKDLTKNYVVVNFEGVSADTLYANTKKYVIKKYNGPKLELTSGEKNEYFSYKTEDVGIGTIKKDGVDVTYFATSTTTVDFKEGRIRITFSKVDVYSIDANSEKRSYPFNTFWNSKDKLVDGATKKLIEDHFNASVQLLIRELQGVKKEAKSSDW